MNISVIFIIVICICIVPPIVGTESHQGVFGQIKSGFAYAGKILGLDRAAEVAQLVSQAFSGRTSKKENFDDPSNTLFSGFLRVLGFDTKRIGAIAVNAIIFIAQIISTSLAKPPPAFVTSERNINGSPLDWMLSNTEVQNYLKHAKNKNLPTHIIDYLKDGDEQFQRTGCIQLLICKSAPLVWGMQRAIKAKGNIITGKSVLTEYLPNFEALAENGDACEVKYPHCKLPLT